MKLQNPDLESILALIPDEDHHLARVAFTSNMGVSSGAVWKLAGRWSRSAWQLGLLGECEVPASGMVSAALPVRVRDFAAYRLRLPLTAVCVTLGILLTVLSQPRMIPGSLSNYLTSAAGDFVLLMGILLRIWSILHIQERKSVSLVMSGPYALTRNPLYLGTLLIFTGYLLMVQSLTLFCCCLPVIALYAWGVVPAEEQVLLHRHGKSYQDFCRQVPRWLPSPGRVRWNMFSSTRLCWSSSVRREVESGGWWILVALLVQLICSYRMADWWQHPLMWP